jgi:hypothetical protein
MASDTQSAETRMAIETLRADTPTLFRPCKQLALLELISDAELQRCSLTLLLTRTNERIVYRSNT